MRFSFMVKRPPFFNVFNQWEDGPASAVIFARKEITSAQEALEGKFGYYPFYQQGVYDRHQLLSKLGERFAEVNVSLKKYPCCMPSQAASKGLSIDESGFIKF